MFVPFVMLKTEKYVTNSIELMAALEKWMSPFRYEEKNPKSLFIPYIQKQCYGILKSYNDLGLLDESITVEMIHAVVENYLSEVLWVKSQEIKALPFSSEMHPEFWKRA